MLGVRGSPATQRQGDYFVHTPDTPLVLGALPTQMFTYTLQAVAGGLGQITARGLATALVSSALLVAPAQPLPIQVIDEALLESSLQVSHARLAAGERVTYTLTLRNAGPLERHVLVTDDLALAGQLTLAELLTETISPGGAFDGRYLRWEADVPAGGALLLSFSMRTRAAALSGCAAPCLLRNSVSLFDGETHYNVTAARTVLQPGGSPGEPPSQPAPDLAGAQYGPAWPLATAGQVVTFEVGALNAGAGAAAVTVTVRLPPAEFAALEGADPAPASVTGRQVVWRMGGLGAGQALAITLRLRVASHAPVGALLRSLALIDDGVNAPLIRVAEAWVQE